MRRLALLLAFVIALVASSCSSTGGALLFGRDISFTAPELQAQLDHQFPREYRKLGGLVRISVFNPQLSLPGGGRLRLDFDIGVAGLGGNDSPAGHFALESGLRFDPGTRGLHLDTPEIVDVNVPALGGMMNDSARTLLNGWLLDYAREEPVYRLDDSTYGRIASRRIQHVDIDQDRITLRMH